MLQNAIPAGSGVMKLVPRRLVIAVIDELPSVEIKTIRPVFILTTRIEDHELLVFPAASRSESSQIAGSRQ